MPEPIRCFILTSLFVFACIPVFSRDTVSTRSTSLDSLVVVGHRYTSPIRETKDGRVLWKMAELVALPKILGNADPIRYMQMLPGIGTNAEMQSGIHIQGCDNSHNVVSINGVPIYNVNHLMGFFSTFNASHFSTMSIQKNLSVSSLPNRLGGGVDMMFGEEQPEKVSGELAVGLISSQGTLKLPLSRKTTLTLSLRVAYLNLLYGRWLKTESSQVKYSFSDYNLTLRHRFNRRHTLTVDFYAGRDAGGMEESGYLSCMRANWGNIMGAIHWTYKGDTYRMNHTLYVTNYHNIFRLSMQDQDYALRSNITDLGYRGQAEYGRWNVGGDVIWHGIQPQLLDTRNTYNISNQKPLRQNTVEASLFADYSLPLISCLMMKFGVRTTLYGVRDCFRGNVDPSVSLLYDKDTWSISASYYLRHQYLFQTGFTNAGFPTEFWVSSDVDNRPQYVHGCNLATQLALFRGRYRLSVEAFYKRLYNQVDYQGNILDLVNKEYNLNGSLIHGHGNNIGFNIMLNKCTGNLRGWLAYSYTHASRRFNELSGQRSYPASHDRPHEFNAVVSYNVSGHWSFGGCLAFASGTPFTAPVSVEFINGCVVSQYGEYNGNRLKAYFRLDVSADYKWKSRGGVEQGVNISLYNVTCRRNDLFYRITTREDNAFAYRPLSFYLPILPSVSYSCKF